MRMACASHSEVIVSYKLVLFLDGEFEFQEFKESSPGAEFLELFVNST